METYLFHINLINAELITKISYDYKQYFILILKITKIYFKHILQSNDFTFHTEWLYMPLCMFK